MAKTVEYGSNMVSVRELNDCLNLLSVSESMEVGFEMPVPRIDIVFVAGLILWWLQNKIKINVTFIFINPDAAFELRQYLKQYKQLYETDWKDIFDKFSYVSDRLIEKDFDYSTSFAPIIYINNDNLDKFFKEKADIESELGKMQQKYINIIKSGKK
jgi:hypothetical protein